MSYVFVALCLGLTYIASQSSYWILKVFAGFFWWGLAFYFVGNPLTDANLQTIVVILCIGIGLACCFWAFWYTSKQINNGVEKENSKFKLPFFKDEDESPSRTMGRNERIDSYARRVRNARNGVRERR